MATSDPGASRTPRRSSTPQQPVLSAIVVGADSSVSPGPEDDDLFVLRVTDIGASARGAGSAPTSTSSSSRPSSTRTTTAPMRCTAGSRRSTPGPASPAPFSTPQIHDNY